MSSAQVSALPPTSTTGALSTERVRTGFPNRLLADLIDGAALVAINVVLFVVGIILVRMLGIVGSMLTSLICSAVVLGYFSLEITKAQSLGKMVMKLTITRQDGSPAAKDQLLKRYLFKMAPAIVGILGFIPLLGLIFTLLSVLLWVAVLVCALMYLKQDKLAVYDQLLGTAVFGPAGATPGFPAMAPSAAVAVPTNPPPPTTPLV